jgi:hypothetical protein
MVEEKDAFAAPAPVVVAVRRFAGAEHQLHLPAA